MTKQVINIGTSVNKGDGDPLRTAFTKINDNFTELYTALGINTDVNLNLGAFEFNDSTMTTTDSSNMTIGEEGTVINIGGDLLPTSNLNSNLGSPDKKWHSLYVGTGSVYFGDARLSLENGKLSSNVGFNLTGSVGEVSGAVDWTNILNKPGFATVSTTGSYDDLTDTPTIPDVSNFITAEDIPTIPSIEGLATEQYVIDAVGAVVVPDVSNFITAEDIPAIPADISDLTDTTDLLQGNIEVPGSWTITTGTSTYTFSYDPMIGGNLEIPGSIQGDLQTGFVSSNGLGIGIDGFNSPNYVDVGNIASSKVLRITDGASGSDVILRSLGAATIQAGTTGPSWKFSTDGDLTLPEGGDILDSTGQSVLGSSAGPVQPYLELTNTPFITQPATLGTPVTITVPATGNGALLSLTITEGPTLDVESVVIDSPGTGYVVGQRYRINYWQIGGGNDDSAVNFEVDSVGEDGELLTVINVAFVGGTATNTPATYTGVSVEYIPSVFDEVDAGLTLARGQYSGLFNSASENSYDWNVSPIGTLWNSEGWGDLLRLGTRDYETFDTLNFNELTTLELVMWDTVNDKHYKFDFTQWDNDNGSYAYTRTLVTDPNYFRKTDGLVEGEVDVIVEHPDLSLLEETYLEAELMFGDFRDQDAQMIAPETRPWDGLPSYQAYELIITYEVPDGVLPPSSALVVMANSTRSNYLTWREALAESVGITRGLQGGIYNPYQEDGWDSDVSPQGIGWNLDGWNDLTDIESRIYVNFYAAYGFGGLGNKVPGSKAVIYVPQTDKYYAIEWLGWTQGGDYGGFSYYRREIDLTKLTQGITFADGTVQTTAYRGTNVVSTAPGQRRIETASGYNQVSVTQRLTDNYTGAVSETTNGYELRVARTPELDAVIIPLNENSTDETYFLSFDNVTFREVWLSSIQQNEYWFYYQNDLGQTTPQTQGDPVYLRIITGGDSVAWWSKNELPGGSDNFRGAVIDYHAFTDEATIIGTIHIVDDDGEEHITHTEVSSGNDDSMNDNLWIVTNEGTIRYARFDGEEKTLKIHWTAKVFYGDETND